MTSCRTSLVLIFTGLFVTSAAFSQSDPLRVGIIGLDTSHVVAFTRILNDPQDPLHVPGATVVVAYPGGSPDIPSSIGRLPRFRKTLEEEWNVQIVDTIPELLERVDAVLLESVDGRTHLEQVKPVLEAGKRVFIDKPLAASLAEARDILRLSRKSGVPFLSASSLRFYQGIRKLLDHPEVGRILGADVFSPAPLEPHHPDLFWYGIHGVEILYTIMGPGCQTVTRVFTEDGEVVVGLWKDGRIGTLRGIRKGKSGYGVRVLGEKGVATSDPVDDTLYRGLIEAIVEFFRTGRPPVSPEETLEMFEFMTAAQLSRERGGVPISLDEVRGSVSR